MKIIKEPEDLTGEILSEVNFVTDYVQFGFSGPLLASIANPVVEISGATRQFPAAGTRDALCALIGETLKSICIEENIGITLSFETGKIVIPLDSKNQRFGESAIFTAGSNMPAQVF